MLLTLTLSQDKMPALSADGARAISSWLNAEVDKRDHPALFAGVATADKMLYFNAKGEKVFGQPEKGQVDGDTGGYWASWPRLLRAAP